MIKTNEKAIERICRATLVCLLLFSPLSFVGQQTTPQTQSLTGVQLKGKVPVNRQTLKINLPKPQEAKLSNGLRVLLIEDHKAPSFAMQMIVLNGGLSDAKGKQGQALLTISLLREGTTKRTSRQIAAQIDALGSQLSANSSGASMTSNITASGLIENVDQTFDILADMMINPTFAEEEINIFKARLLAQLQVVATDPSLTANVYLYKVIYGDFPAANVFPSEASVNNLTREDLIFFHKANYRPNNTFLAIIGDISMKQLLPKLEKSFGNWKSTTETMEAAPLADIARPAKSQIYLIDRPGSVQTSIYLGNLGVKRTIPDYYAVRVMHEILGSGPSSRLFTNLREKNGYTYGANSFFDSWRFNGVVGAFADVRTEVTEGAMKEFLYELHRMTDEKVPQSELEEAKRSIIGRFALSLDNQNALLTNVVQQQIYNFPPNYWDEYPKKIDTVTSDDVQRVAQKYINPATLQIVAVGDAAKIRPMLEKFGNVQIAGTNQ